MLAKFSRQRTLDLVCVAILIGVSLFIALPRYRAGIDWADEGFLAYGAVRVMDGQLPNRDFVSLQPPISFYTVALAFKILGTSLASLRTFGLLVYIAVSLVIYALARTVLSPLFALAAALPATIMGIPEFSFVPFAVWQGILASLIAATLYLRAALTGRLWMAVCAGIATAISIFSRHDQGVYLVISILVLAAALKFALDANLRGNQLFRMFGGWFVGLAVITSMLVLFWWSQGALGEMFKQLVLFPLTTYGKTSSVPFPSFTAQESTSEHGTVVLFYLPPVAMLLGAVWLGRRIWQQRFDTRDAVLTFLVAWSALFYCQVLTRSDVNHLLITLPPFFVLVAFLWKVLIDVIPVGRSLKISGSFAMVLAAGIFLWTIRSFLLGAGGEGLEMLDLPRGGVRVENARWLETFIRTAQGYVPPDRPILVLFYQPMFYFLCERHNPTRWNYLWPGDQNAQDHAELIAEAKKDPPAAIFITNEEALEASAPSILDYVHSEYSQAAGFTRLNVYLPRDTTR